MPKLHLNQFLDDDFEPYPDRQQHRRASYHPNYKPKRSQPRVFEALAEQADGQESFDFSYQASRHERQWIIDSLGDFYENQWISDVLRLLKGGKEATVYQCAATQAASASPAEAVRSVEKDRVQGYIGAYIAAKVYRPRMFRNLKKDHLYREGRVNLDANGNTIIEDGMLHAMQKKSQYGLQLLHTSWIEHEHQTLQVLHAAGADVPEAYVADNNAILMEYIGADDMPAPTLNTVQLDLSEASLLFERVLRNIDLMLAHECVHGDLSAYNILYWEGDIRLIDFPQVVNPHDNRNALRIFERDVRHVCEYFARQGVECAPARLSAELWTAHGNRLRPEVHPRLLDDQDEKDRDYWQSLRNGS